MFVLWRVCMVIYNPKNNQQKQLPCVRVLNLLPITHAHTLVLLLRQSSSWSSIPVLVAS